MRLMTAVKAFFDKREQAKKAEARAALIWPQASRVVDFYKGYPYVFAVPWQCYDNEYWSQFSDSYEGMGELMDWCREHDFKEFRSDVHRVSLSNTYNSHNASEYIFDEMGGGDVKFFAFTSSEDFCFFALRWGYIAS